MLVELRWALISYQDYHMLLLTLAGETGIRFLQPCAGVAWSGGILRDNTFAVSYRTQPFSVPFVVRDPGQTPWRDYSRLESLVMQYRRTGCVGPSRPLRHRTRITSCYACRVD